MAYFERDSEPRIAGWRDLIMSLAVVGALAAGLLLSACGSNLPEMAQMFKEATLGRPASSDENLVNKGYREIETGNYAYAEIYLDSALSINPSNPFALLNMAIVYEKTGRESEARALYSTLIRRNPSDVSGTVLTEEDSDRSIAEVARDNLAVLDRAVIARAARNTDSPIEAALEPMQQNLESDWRARMDERISVLQDLFAEGFISEDELLARLGGAWSRSHGDASPNISEVSYRVETLESLLQRGMISTQSYAVERGHVLDKLAPIMAMPEGQIPQAIAMAEPPAGPPTGPRARSTAQQAAGTSADTPGDVEAPAVGENGDPPASAATPEIADAEGGAHVHLASYRSQEAAQRGWETLKQRHADLLGELSRRVNEVDLGPGKGVYYRIEAGPFSDQKGAVALCEKLKTRNMFCTVTA